MNSGLASNLLLNRSLFFTSHYIFNSKNHLGLFVLPVEKYPRHFASVKSQPDALSLSHTQTEGDVNKVYLENKL